MIVQRLTLTNVRAFPHAEFEFGAGMNLLVGVNGVGKSTVLDSLRVLLSNALRQISKSGEKEKTFNFRVDDISVGLPDQNPTLTAKLSGKINHDYFVQTIEKRTLKFIPNPSGAVNIRQQTIRTPDTNKLVFDPTAMPGETTPIAVFFSPHRSI